MPNCRKNGSFGWFGEAMSRTRLAVKGPRLRVPVRVAVKAMVTGMTV